MKAGIAGVRFGLGEWIMKQRCLRILTGTLIFSMLFSSAACGRSTGTEGFGDTGFSAQDGDEQQGQRDGQNGSSVFNTVDAGNSEGTHTDLHSDENPSSDDIYTSLDADYVSSDDPYISNDTITLSVPKKEGREPDKELFGEFAILDQSVAGVYFRNYDATAEEAARSECGIAIYTFDGDLIADVELEPGEEAIRVYAMKNGNIAAVIREGMTKKILLLTPSGEVLKKEQMDPLIWDIDNPSAVVLDSGNILYYGDGVIYLLDEEWNLIRRGELASYNNDKIVEIGGKYYEVYNTGTCADGVCGADAKNMYREIDTEGLAFSEAKELPGELNIPYMIVVNGEPYVQDNDGLTRVNYLTGESSRILDWAAADMRVDRIDAMKVLSDQELYMVSKDGKEWQLTHFARERNNPHAGRRIIYVAVDGINDAYKRKINEYNSREESLAWVSFYAPNQESDYGGYTHYLDAEAADLMLQDMKAGEGPDVLINYADFGQFDKEENLVDLNPYLDGSDGIDRSLYFDNILRAFEVDGKLHQMPLTVIIDALIGNAGLIDGNGVILPGGVARWNVEDFGKKMSLIPDGTATILYQNVSDGSPEMSATGILLNLLCHDMDRYVDYSRGEVHFDSDGFRDLLALAKALSPDMDSGTLQSIVNGYVNKTNVSPNAMMLEDGLCAVTVMRPRWLMEFAEYIDRCRGQVVFMGWPAADGRDAAGMASGADSSEPQFTGGISAEALTSIGISAYSTAKDEAWDFVKFMLSPDVQTDLMTDSSFLVYGVSICRESEAEAIQIEVDDYPNYLAKNGGAGSALIEGVAEPDERVVGAYLELIENITTRVRKNPAYTQIVMQEVASYFDGEVSADEVSKSIQSRASTVMAESQ